MDISKITQQFVQIDEQRRIVLDKLAATIQNQVELNGQLSLAFICTHNSRRSQLAQAWFWVACQYYHIKNITCLSAGTEITALNHRVVSSMKRFGLLITSKELNENTHYSLNSPFNEQQLVLYSKKVDAFDKETDAIMAVMVCDHASEHCPVVYFDTIGHLHYVDPKYADDLPEESETYDQSQHIIQLEMVYLVSKLVKTI